MLPKSSQMENFFTQYNSMHPALTNTHAGKILTNGKFPHPAWLYVSLQLLQMHTYARKILTNGKFPHPAWLYISLQLLQMHIYDRKILTNGKFPHPCSIWFYASSSYKCTHTLEKSPQMETFLTQYDSLHPDAHVYTRKSSQTENFLTRQSIHLLQMLANRKISSPSMILCLQLLQMHTH